MYGMFYRIPKAEPSHPDQNLIRKDFYSHMIRLDRIDGYTVDIQLPSVDTEDRPNTTWFHLSIYCGGYIHYSTMTKDDYETFMHYLNEVSDRAISK